MNVTPAEHQAATRVLDALAPSSGYSRGVLDAYQDACEGAPWSSVGGFTVGEIPVPLRAPHWVLKESASYQVDYLRGYEAQAKAGST